MKKLAFTLLLLWGAISTLSAQQNFKTDLFAYLKNEGYVPSYDEDGDIRFKMKGIGYYVLVKVPDHERYAYVEVMANFSTDTSLDKLLTVSNEFNRNKYLCKCVAYEDGEDRVFTVAMEFLTGSRSESEFQMNHALRLLPGWIEAFEEQL